MEEDVHSVCAAECKEQGGPVWGPEAGPVPAPHLLQADGSRAQARRALHREGGGDVTAPFHVRWREQAAPPPKLRHFLQDL